MRIGLYTSIVGQGLWADISFRITEGVAWTLKLHVKIGTHSFVWGKNPFQDSLSGQGKHLSSKSKATTKSRPVWSDISRPFYSELAWCFFVFLSNLMKHP